MTTKQRILGVGCTMALVLAATAFHEPQQPQLPNFDRRPANHVVQAERAKAAADLKHQVHRAEVEFHPITGSVKQVGSTERFLTAPKKGNDPYGPTKSFLDSNRVLFGHGSEVLATAPVKREFVTEHNQMRTVVWEQQVDGIAVFEGLLISHTSRNGELVNVSSHFLRDAAKAADSSNKNRAALAANPTISAQEALAIAAENVGEVSDKNEVTAVAAAAGANKQQKLKSAVLLGEADIHLVWLPTSDATMTLCWEATFTSRKRGEMFKSVVDAQTGEVVVRHCLTQYISPATYRVYTSDSPSPLSPGYSTPVTNQPPLVSRSLVTLSAISTTASPNGWIDDGQNQTLGNNVDAHTDLNGDNIADPGSRPQGSPSRTFDFPLDLTLAPLTYTNAAVVQLFYWNNFMHDKLYSLGFTEAAGNFQTTNFGRGGFGNDAVQADAQDGGGVNNANFSTPTDGSAGRMQMYVFTGPTPDRDGDLDAEVVLHEYTHGLSNRRVGGGVGISALQTAGMGEGWSDFYALSMLSESGDNVNGNYGAGGYASFLDTTSYSNNYYFGIRRYPYTTDMTRNPLTFKDIDSAQASTHPGVPKSPLGSSSASEVHNQGELWCVTLWDVRANLINKYGWAIGNQLALQIVTDGMNLSVANPNFLQSRDAILQADFVDNAGANRNELWAAFAKRGMGYFATSPVSSTTTGIVESYVVPDDLSVTPTTAQVLIGPVGGPFPAPVSLVLSNSGSNALSWSATKSSSWLNISSSGGTLPAKGSVSLNVTLTSVAATLAQGVYTDTVRITNTTSGVGQTRQITLRAGQIDYFTEQFTSAQNDLANMTLTFTPDGSGNYYSACREVVTNFPTDPLGGTNIVLGNHVTKTMTLTNGASISIYGKTASILYVSSDGHITINSPDATGAATLTNHFSLPRVSALLSHLHPADNGGAVYWQQLSNRVAVTFLRVQEYATTNTNSFQFELFFDGKIRLTWLTIGTTAGVSGLSAGNGYPIDYVKSDLTGYGSCSLPLTLTLPPPATEGDGTAGPAYVALPFALSNDFVITLSSSDTNEIITPAQVTIPAGQTNATFILTVVDDNFPDGTQFPIITASAAGFKTASAPFAVNDDELVYLQVTAPSQVTEGGNAGVGTVSIPFAAQKTVQVFLSSSDLTELTVPSSVFIPVGQTSATFAVTAVDDHEIDGFQDVTIVASVTNWQDGTTTVRVLDNEPTNLTMTIPATASEAAGVLTNAGRVSISGTLTHDLTTALTSSDPTQVVVPASVTIVAGQTSAAFNLTMIDNAVADGTRGVVVVANTPGFTGATNLIQIFDDESPATPTNPSPANLASNVIASVDLSWSSGETVPTNNVYSVYFGTNPNPGPAELLGTTQTTAWALPNLMPLTTYYWRIVSSRTVSTAGPTWQFTTRGVDHFVFTPLTSPKYLGLPFPLTVTAKDQFETTVSNFTGSVKLGAYGAVPSAPLLSEDFEDGDFVGWTPSGTSGITQTVTSETAAGGTNSLTIFGITTASHFTGISRTLGNIQPAQVSYYVRASNTNALGYFVLVGNSTATTDTLAWIYCYTNTLQIVADSIPTISVPIATNTWIPVSLVFNWTNHSYALYVNNQLISPNVPFRGASVTSVNTLYLYNFQPGQAWWDDINILSAGVSAQFAMTPTNSGSFTDGSWTGNVAVLQTSTNVVINANDGAGHVGNSTGFAVLLTNDLAVTLTNSIKTNVVGGNFTLNMTVATTGPNVSSHVVVTNTLPPSANVVGASSSVGGFSIVSGAVIFNLGTVSPGTPVNLGVTFNMPSAGTFTTGATVSRDEPDAYPTNNSVTTSFTVVQPTISIADATVAEGSQGTSTNAVFKVTLSTAAALPVQVNFATAPLNTTAGVDYVSTNGTISFSPGETNKTISVTVSGDNIFEPNETFNVALSNPINIVVARALALGTIVNDDPAPTLSIADVSVTEGNAGTTNLTFVVTLNGATAVPATVDIHTADGTATSPSDYVAVPTTTLTFAPGETQKTVSVTVYGDTAIEPDETFYLLLANQTGANIARSVAVGTIVDDDTGVGVLDNFAWAPVATPEAAGEPFAVTLSARDRFGAAVTNFIGNVDIMSLDGKGVFPPAVGPFTNGVWSGWLTMATITSNTTVLRASDNAGHFGDSPQFKVIFSFRRVLSIATNGTGQVISWGAPVSSYILEYATDLQAPVWSPVTNSYVQTNTTIFINDTITDGQRFYRLRR